MRRGGVELMGGLLIVLAALNQAQAQVGFDRLGGDYTNFPLRSGDPAQCAARCERDQRCRAWAFSYPVTENAVAVCWLKSRVPPRVAATCCVSGVRGAGVIEPRSDPIEFGIDRFGGDYRNIELAPDPSGKSCAAACAAEPQCRAWTYVRPGYVGTSATCFLKEHVTSPQHHPCCISGVVR
ncbi:MAG TPA: PAN domain-containing protein [Xanthobacteraceae bacterium]